MVAQQAANKLASENKVKHHLKTHYKLKKLNLGVAVQEI